MLDKTGNSETTKQLLERIDEAAKAVNESEAVIATAQADHVPKCKALGLALLDLKALYPKVKAFEAKLKECKHVKLATAYDYMRLVGGRKTDEEIRQAERERKEAAKVRKRKSRAALPKPEPEPSVRMADGSPIDTGQLSAAAQAAIKAALGDAALAQGSSEPEPKLSVTLPNVTETFNNSPAKKSKRILASGKSWLDEYLDEMFPEDRAELFDYFKFHSAMIGIKRKAA